MDPTVGLRRDPAPDLDDVGEDAAVAERDPSVQPTAPEPATRIGQRNAEVRERNRVLEAARKALEVAREAAAEGAAAAEAPAAESSSTASMPPRLTSA